MCCVPGKAARPCQVAVSVLPPSTNVGSASPHGVAREQLVALRAEHQPPSVTSPFLISLPPPLRVNGKRRWVAKMPVNKAQLLGAGGGEGQRTKMRTSLYTAPVAAAATCPSPRMEIAAQLCLPPIESVTLHLDRLFELKNDSLYSLEGFFSPRQVAHEGPMDASCLVLGFF